RMQHRIGDRIPVRGASVEPEPRRDRRKTMTSGPAHGRRMGMNALAAPIFPDAVVGLERKLARLGSQLFQQPKQSLVARTWQSPIVKHRHCGEDNAAIGVVLHLLCGGITQAHRPVAAVSFEFGCYALIHWIDRNDAVDRAHLLVWI